MTQKVLAEKILQDVPPVFKNDNILNSPCSSGPVSSTPSLDIGTDVPVKSSCWMEKSGVEVGVEGSEGARRVALRHTMVVLC